jgi:DNA-binding transcriptional LysR family regulator
MDERHEGLDLGTGILEVEFSTFLAVVRHGTFSSAAERLNVSQSTVSYRLRTLERRLGLVLLDRGRGRLGAHLTANGEALLNLAGRWEALHADIQQLARRGTSLGIGASDSVNSYILADAYASLAAHRPEVQLHVVTGNSRALYQLLDQHEIDVAFTLYGRATPGCRVEEFLKEPMVVVTGGSLPTKDGQITLSQLDPRNELRLGWPDPISGSRGARGETRISVDVSHLVQPFLANRRNWTIVPASMEAALATAGGWKSYAFSGANSQRVIYKVVRTRLPREARQTYDLLETYLQAAKRRIGAV